MDLIGRCWKKCIENKLYPAFLEAEYVSEFGEFSIYNCGDITYILIHCDGEYTSGSDNNCMNKAKAIYAEMENLLFLPENKVFITGHSFSGGVAQCLLTLFPLCWELSISVSAITFGAPRCLERKELTDRQSINVINGLDIIPILSSHLADAKECIFIGAIPTFVDNIQLFLSSLNGFKNPKWRWKYDHHMTCYDASLFEAGYFDESNFIIGDQI